MMSVLYYEGYGELKKRTPNNPIFACLSFLELNFPKVIPQRQLSSKKDMILKPPDSAHLSAFILSSTLYWIFLFSYGKVIELFRPLNNTANSKEPQYLLLQEIKFWLKSYLLQYLCNIILLRRLTWTVFQNILKGYLRIRQKKKINIKGDLCECKKLSSGSFTAGWQLSVRKQTRLGYSLATLSLSEFGELAAEPCRQDAGEGSTKWTQSSSSGSPGSHTSAATSADKREMLIVYSNCPVHSGE